ncbi:MAG: acyl carrier protein [Planctomycetaceae bacterium]|nr:acyl carrier protein [Planctomycetaceae bacterium]
MTEQVDIKKTISGVINRILTDSGRDVREISDDDTFMDTIGLDSLDLAVMVVGLEQSLGVDPFREGAQAVQTVGELVELYRNTINAS